MTITVTEAAYLRNAEGRLDTDQEVIVADLQRAAGRPAQSGQLITGQARCWSVARRDAGVGAITILSCDNLPENGVVTWTVVTELAALVDESLPEWIHDNVDFATSMVDRITPVTTDEDRRLVQEHNGYVDAFPVPTEPFSEWVVSGRFPAGRPRWEDSGVQLVDDVAPFEHRKLWLLNASHSLLAYAGSIRRHETIDQAIADPACREWVNLAWDEASRNLPLPPAEVTGYREALLTRFSNPRMGDQLARIAADGSTKLVVRTLPTIRAERAAGRIPVGCATTVAAWVLHLRGLGAPVKDPGAAAAQQAANSGDLPTAVPAVLDTLDPGRGADEDFVRAVVGQAEAITTSSE